MVAALCVCLKVNAGSEDMRHWCYQGRWQNDEQRLRWVPWKQEVCWLTTASGFRGHSSVCVCGWHFCCVFLWGLTGSNKNCWNTSHAWNKFSINLLKSTLEIQFIHEIVYNSFFIAAFYCMKTFVPHIMIRKSADHHDCMSESI